MLIAQPDDVCIVCLECSETLNGDREARAFREVASRVPIPLHPAFLERKVDHRSQEQHRCQRMFMSESIRCRRQDLIVVAVDLPRPLKDESRGLVRGGPGHKEGEGLMRARERQSMGHGAFFSLEIIEVGKALQVG